jgi:hypothetical protein
MVSSHRRIIRKCSRQCAPSKRPVAPGTDKSAGPAKPCQVRETRVGVAWVVWNEKQTCLELGQNMRSDKYYSGRRERPAARLPRRLPARSARRIPHRGSLARLSARPHEWQPRRVAQRPRQQPDELQRPT